MKIIFTAFLVLPLTTLAMQQSDSAAQANLLQVKAFFATKIYEKLGQYSKMAMLQRTRKTETASFYCELYRYYDAYVLKALEKFQENKSIPLEKIVDNIDTTFPSSMMLRLITDPDPRIIITEENVNKPEQKYTHRRYAPEYVATNQAKGLLADLEKIFEEQFTSSEIAPETPK